VTAATASVSLSPASDALACPLCHGALEPLADGLGCARCAREYSSHRGILDLRVFPDAYLGVERDNERADLIVAALERGRLADLLDYYWSLSDSTPPVLRERFARGALRAPAKARRLLDLLERAGLASRQSRVLELGSGTGGFLVEASGRVGEVVGLDIAMRWLHVSRRRFLDRGSAVPPLVCACAEQLPFPDASFDLVVCAATFELIRDPDRALAECARVLKQPGALFLNAVNRCSLVPEPHVGLWGVGFLPRAWQAPYVRWRGRGDFAHVRPLSYWDLDRRAARHFRRRRFEPADVADEVVAELSRVARHGVRVYRALKRFGVGRWLFRRLGPEWDVVLTRDEPPARESAPGRR